MLEFCCVTQVSGCRRNLCLTSALTSISKLKRKIIFSIKYQISNWGWKAMLNLDDDKTEFIVFKSKSLIRLLERMFRLVTHQWRLAQRKHLTRRCQRRLMWTLLPRCAFTNWETLLEFFGGFLMKSARSLFMPILFQSWTTVMFFCMACLAQLHRSCNDLKTALVWKSRGSLCYKECFSISHYEKSLNRYFYEKSFNWYFYEKSLFYVFVS